MSIDAQWLKPSIHPVYGRMLGAHLLQLGFSEAQVFAGTFLDRTQLETRSEPLTPASLERMILQGLQLTQKPWLALEMSTITRPYVHGPLGFGALAGPDVRTSLELVAQQLPLRQNMIGLAVEESGESVRLLLQEKLVSAEVREFLLGLAAATLVTLLEVMTGQAPDGTLYLSFPEPEWAGEYAQHFAPLTVVYGAEATALVLPAEWLDKSCLMADPQIFANAQLELERLLKHQGLDGTVSQKVYEHLLKGGAPYPKLDEFAVNMNMSARTLMRKLKAEGNSYQGIIDEIRRESALWYLRQSKLSIEQVSDALGFEDASNFSRTFQRWFEMTPSKYRAEQGLKKL